MNDEADEDDPDEEDEEETEEDNDEDKAEHTTHAIFIADMHETKTNEGDRELEGKREAPSK